MKRRPEPDDFDYKEIPPPMTEDYKIMRRIIDDAERYFNLGSKDIEEILLKKLANKIKAYCANE